MAQAGSRQFLSAGAWVCFKDIPSRICGGQNVKASYGFFSISVLSISFRTSSLVIII